LDMRLSSGDTSILLACFLLETRQITEFEDTIEVGDLDFKGKDRNARFPCITGDLTGSEIAEFLKRLCLGPNTKDASKSRGLSKRLYKSCDHDHDIYFFSIVLESCLTIKGRTLTVSQSHYCTERGNCYPLLHNMPLGSPISKKRLLREVSS